MEAGSPTPDKRLPPTIVVGLGNPLLGDDGIGWRVAEEVRGRIERAGLAAEVDCLAVGGLRLMERLVGYERAIVVDALTTGRRPPGAIWRCSLDDLPDPAAGHLGSSHDATLQTALAVGRSLGARLPDDVIVVGVEAERVYEFSEELSPAVAAALPTAVESVMEILSGGLRP